MKECIVQKDNKFYQWKVEGNNENACINDIKENQRTEHSDYTKEMFEQRYGCTATVIELDKDEINSNKTTSIQINMPANYELLGYAGDTILAVNKLESQEPFVTWKYANDSTIMGNYFAYLENAQKDFCERAFNIEFPDEEK